jgi:hypothetical protein
VRVCCFLDGDGLRAVRESWLGESWLAGPRCPIWCRTGGRAGLTRSQASTVHSTATPTRHRPRQRSNTTTTLYTPAPLHPHAARTSRLSLHCPPGRGPSLRRCAVRLHWPLWTRLCRGPSGGARPYTVQGPVVQRRMSNHDRHVLPAGLYTAARVSVLEPPSPQTATASYIRCLGPPAHRSSASPLALPPIQTSRTFSASEGPPAPRSFPASSFRPLVSSFS